MRGLRAGCLRIYGRNNRLVITTLKRYHILVMTLRRIFIVLLLCLLIQACMARDNLPPSFGEAAEKSGIAAYLQRLEWFGEAPLKACLAVYLNGKLKRLVGENEALPWRYLVKKEEFHGIAESHCFGLAAGGSYGFISTENPRGELLFFHPQAVEASLRLDLLTCPENGWPRLPLPALSLDGLLKGIQPLCSLHLSLGADGRSGVQRRSAGGGSCKAALTIHTGGYVRPLGQRPDGGLDPHTTAGMSGKISQIGQLAACGPDCLYRRFSYKTWPTWSHIQPDSGPPRWERLDQYKNHAESGYAVMIALRGAGTKGDLFKIKLPDWVRRDHLSGAEEGGDLESLAPEQREGVARLFGEFFHDFILQAGRRGVAFVSPLNEPNHPGQDGWLNNSGTLDPMIYDLLSRAFARGQQAKRLLEAEGFAPPLLGLNINIDTTEGSVESVVMHTPERVYGELQSRADFDHRNIDILLPDTYPGTWLHAPAYEGALLARHDPVRSADIALKRMAAAKSAYDRRFGTDIPLVIGETGWSTVDNSELLQSLFMANLFERIAEYYSYSSKFRGFVWFITHDHQDAEYGWKQDSGFGSMVESIWSRENQFGISYRNGTPKLAWETFNESYPLFVH